MYKEAFLQILHQQWPKRRIRYPVDIPWFNVEGVQFWRHFGFWSPEIQELFYTIIIKVNITEFIKKKYACMVHVFAYTFSW
jgi:hypothetical protein